MADEQTTTPPVEREVSMEIMKYKEELAEKMGLPSPYGMQLMKQVAQDLVSSGMLPKHWGTNPMAVFGAAIRGRELGLSPMESAMETFWQAPGGNLGMYAKKMLQLMHQNGVTSKFLREDAEECQILFTPPAPHEPYTAKFEAAEAVIAGLDKPDSNWKKWRTDMNRARAISRGYRALLGTFGKASNFAGYSKEEMEDTGMTGEVTVDATPQPPEGKYTSAPKAATAPVVDAKVNGAAEPPKATAKPKTKAQEHAEAARATAPPPATDTGKVIFEIHRHGVDGKPHHLKDEDSASKEGQRMRAQALANETGYIHEIVEFSGGERVSMGRFQPPKPISPDAEPPVAAAPAKSAEPAQDQARIRARFNDLIASIKSTDAGKDLKDNVVGGTVKAFLCAYLGVDQLPVAESSYFSAMPDCAMAIRYSLEDLLKNPRAVGTNLAKDNVAWEQLTKHSCSNWDANVIGLMRELARQRGNSCEEMQKHLKLVMGKDWDMDVTPGDARAYFRVALKARQAGALWKLCAEHKMPFATTVGQMELKELGTLPVEKCKEKDVDEAIGRVITKTKKVAAEKPEPPAAPPSDNEVDDGSFDFLANL